MRSIICKNIIYKAEFIGRNLCINIQKRLKSLVICMLVKRTTSESSDIIQKISKENVSEILDNADVRTERQFHAVAQP